MIIVEHTVNTNIQPRWQTYLVTFALIAPALFVWVAATILVLPKFQQISAHAGMTLSFVQRVIAISDIFISNWPWWAGISGVTVVVFERKTRFWPRVRWHACWVLVLFVNTGVLVFLSTLLVAFAMIAPALSQQR